MICVSTHLTVFFEHILVLLTFSMSLYYGKSKHICCQIAFVSGCKLHPNTPRKPVSWLQARPFRKVAHARGCGHRASVATQVLK